MNTLRRIRRTLERYAKYGFLFFVIKGLLWLLIPALIAAFFSSD